MPPKESLILKRKTVFVAGQTGLVGKALLSRLQSEQVSILSASHDTLDLANQSQTYNWLKDHKPDFVIMAAGKVGGIGANKNDQAGFLNENLSIAQNIIHGAYEAGVQNLLYLGSSCIYPKRAPQPIEETALLSGALESTNEGYAIAKIAGLKLCEFYNKQYGLNYTSAMPTNLYGPNDHFNADHSHVIPALIHKIHKAKIDKEANVSLWGTGSPLREFLYIDDLADALIHILKHYYESAPINVGSGEETSIKDLSNIICNVIGYEGGVIWDKEKPDGTPRKLLNNQKLNDLGWEATTSLKVGLEKTYQWYLKSQKI